MLWTDQDEAKISSIDRGTVEIPSGFRHIEEMGGFHTERPNLDFHGEISNEKIGDHHSP